MKWIKLWTQETITGTTFTELDAAQRGIWFSLLLLAGRAPREGIVEARQGQGYTVEHLAGEINVDPDLILPTIKRLLEVKKISLLPKTQAFPPPKLRLKVRNWKKYQTEYARYRKGKTSKDLGTGYTSNGVSKPTSNQKTEQYPTQSKSKNESESENKISFLPANAVKFEEYWNSRKRLRPIRKMTPPRLRNLHAKHENPDFAANWMKAVDSAKPGTTADWFLKEDNWMTCLELASLPKEEDVGDIRARAEIERTKRYIDSIRQEREKVERGCGNNKNNQD
jgi:hypothetical protein